MIDDPIVEDVYRAREKILEECGGDLDRYMERLKAAEAEHEDRLVTLEDVRKRRQRSEKRHAATE